MSGKPAARQTDPTSCPLPGHGTNPIASGSPDVLFDGLRAARESDTSACGSPLVSGLSSTVIINGMRAATLDSAGAHGNVVIQGSGTIVIGDNHTPAPFIPPTPLQAQRKFSQIFSITDSETNSPLAYREFVADVDGKTVCGITDAEGLAHVAAPSESSTVSLHVKFKSPVRALDEFMEEAQ